MIPDLLHGVVPSIGSTWVWEPLKRHARARVRVTGVRWNGEEVWIESEEVLDKSRHWNELSRWIEATVRDQPDEALPASAVQFVKSYPYALTPEQAQAEYDRWRDELTHKDH